MAHTTTTDGALRRLAEAYRVSTTYSGFDGPEREVPEPTLRAVLDALGADAGDDAAIEAVVLAHARDRLGRRVRTEHRLDRIRRDRGRERERRGDDEPHDDQRPADPADDLADHRGTGPRGPTSSHADA